MATTSTDNASSLSIWIVFIVLSVIVVVLVIYWLVLGFDTVPQNYAPWITRPGPCINGQQEVTLSCSDPEVGCLIDGRVMVQDQHQLQSCQADPASARWLINQTVDSTTWFCESTGTSGPNLCTLAESGNALNSTSIELKSQPIGTVIEVKRPVVVPSTPVTVVDNQLIWDANCKALPDHLNQNLPLLAGTLGPVPEGLNMSTLRQGTYPLSKYLKQDSQLCRVFPDPNFGPGVSGPYLGFLQQAIQIEELSTNRLMLLPLEVATDYSYLKVMIIDLDVQEWLIYSTQGMYRKRLAQSYPWNREHWTSFDVYKAKGQWTFHKQKVFNPYRLTVQCPNYPKLTLSRLPAL